MPKFIIAYHGGDQPSSPEEGKQHMEKWNTWLNDLGESVINRGTPLKGSKVVGPDRSVTDAAKDAMNGYTVIDAESEQEALDAAKACPFLDVGGSLLVAEMIEMN